MVPNEMIIEGGHVNKTLDRSALARRIDALTDAIALTPEVLERLDLMQERYDLRAIVERTSVAASA